MLMMVSTTFVGCVDDNDDTEAPYLTITPSTLQFTIAGEPAEGSQSYFEISTNRTWTAKVLDDKSWVTLSAIQGDGNTKVNVSIPGGINDEATIEVIISNKVGPLKKEYVTIKSGDVVEAVVIYHTNVGSTAVSSPYPFVDAYTDWQATGVGASAVTYSGEKASIRSSGLANTGSYNGASGPNVVFFGTLPANFVINKIALTDQDTNLQLTFGASYSFKPEGATDYDNTFDISKFQVMLSADGTSWTPLTYTKNNGDEKTPYWVLATADFTLTAPTAELYIKFNALAASAYRLDDITLQTGNGGQSISLDGGTTPPPSGEATPITIAELNAMMTTTQTPVDATADRYFEAIVLNDTVAKNFSANQLIVSTEGATTAGNGVTLYGSQVDPRSAKVNKGDKIKVTLVKGLANVVNFKGLHEVTGGKTDTWAIIEKISTASVTTAPIVIQPADLKSYQGMLVTVQNATPSAAGIWGGSTAHTFAAGGTNFGVFCSLGATFAEVPFVVATGNVTGISTVYNDASQIIPRDLNDVTAFNSTAPTIIDVNPETLVFAAAGGEQKVTVTCSNQGSNALTVSGLSNNLSAVVNGNEITVTATANNTDAAINQVLTISLENGNSKTVNITLAGQSTGEEATITLNLSDDANYPTVFPRKSADKLVAPTQYTFGGYQYTLAGTATGGFYQALSSGTLYLMVGKLGGYVELPVVEGKRLSKVYFKSRSGASTNVRVAITDVNNAEVAGGAAVQLNNTVSYDYTYTLPSTAKDTKYRIYIANEYNAQFTEWTLTYE